MNGPTSTLNLSRFSLQEAARDLRATEHAGGCIVFLFLIELWVVLAIGQIITWPFRALLALSFKAHP